jgi:peptide/nickel transport system permease protein
MSTVVSERARERGRIEEGATATAGDRPAGRRLALRPRIVFSLVIVGLVAACALFPGGIAPHDPLKPDLAARLAPPFWMTGGTMAHPLGTDSLGRDLLSRVIYGARIAAVVGVSAVLLAGLVGVALGLLAGFHGGILDTLIARLADLALAVPYIILAVAVVAVVGADLVTLVVVLALSTWVTYARIVRGEVMALRQSEFVVAARAMGASNPRIMLRHVLPNVSNSILVVATQQLASMILYEAALSFLGLGVPPPTPTWGGMVADGRLYLATSWWVSTLPGLAILVTVVAVNWLGDWVRDLLEPRKIRSV